MPVPTTTSKVLDLSVVFGALLLAALAVSAKPLGFPLPTVINELVWFGLPLLGAAILAGRGALALLGLTRLDARGVAVALGGTLAMFAWLWFASESGPSWDPGALWRGAIRAGLVEEPLFRGLAFGVLFWRLGWSFPAAMLTTGVIFGGMHIPGAVLSGELGQVWGAALLTGVGGCWFAWLYARWNRSLWVPIAAHVAMNACWVSFTVGPTAAGGGSAGLWSRVAAITIITVATFRLTDTESSPG